MNYIFHPDAEVEFGEAVAYYESCQKGLGIDFNHEVYFTIQNVVDFPLAWPMIYMDVRRCLINRFPYAVLYGMHKDIIYILAVMNLHRDPDYWKHRIDS